MGGLDSLAIGECDMNAICAGLLIGAGAVDNKELASASGVGDGVLIKRWGTTRYG